MPEREAVRCRICETRRPRRFCPGVRDDICPQCCGTEREIKIDCPPDCSYLTEARQHEKLLAVNPADFPNKDIQVSESFLRDNEPLIFFLAGALLAAAAETPAITDADAREGLASLIKTYRTLQSGIIYESMPPNPYAAFVHQRVQQTVARLRQERAQQSALLAVRDAAVLGVLVFLEQVALTNNNGRPRGRAFLDFLRGHFEPLPAEPGAAPAPGLVV